MEDVTPNTTAPPAPFVVKQGKKGKKVRSVWIAFVGRIVAQFVGSAATIVLGLLLLHKYQTVASADDVSATGPAVSADQMLPASALPRSQQSIAVLPLLSFSKDASNQYVADSMTEVLTTTLAQVPGLHVTSRTSAASSKGQERSLPAVAESLGVRYIIEGSVAEANGRMRITAQLIDATRDEHVWARQYDRPASRDMLRVQDEIAALIVRDLNAALTEDGAPIPTSGPGEGFEFPAQTDGGLRLARRDQ